MYIDVPSQMFNQDTTSIQFSLQKKTTFELREEQKREQYAEDERRRRAGGSPPHATRPGRSGETTFPAEAGRAEGEC